MLQDFIATPSDTVTYEETPTSSRVAYLKRRLEETIAEARKDFKNEIQPFLKKYGVPEDVEFVVSGHQPDAKPVYVVTGASFTPYSHNEHGCKDTHAFWHGAKNESYIMNNTAALLVKLLESGERVIVHSKDVACSTLAIKQYYDAGQVYVVGGDLTKTDALKPFYSALCEVVESGPISEVRFALYNSFAQSSGEPFKPMHVEAVEEVEGAATRRLRFIYNMTAFAYDLMVNRGQTQLRLVSLSALASKRPSYGLLADATDKVVCDAAWRTFHIESNFNLGNPVSVIQINPGIVTAGAVYEGQAKKIVLQESLADGHPLSAEILGRERDLPQMSSNDVADVTALLLTTPIGVDPNVGLPPRIRRLLNAGRDSLEELRDAVDKEIVSQPNQVKLGTGGTLPEYVFSSHTVHGALPLPKLDAYQRVMLTPPGQLF